MNVGLTTMGGIRVQNLFRYVAAFGDTEGSSVTELAKYYCHLAG
jgi:hypothetical protein